MEQDANGNRTRTITEYELYRFIDATDNDHSGLEIEFEDTLVNGTRNKEIEFKTGSIQPNISASEDFSLRAGDNGSTVVEFKPTQAAQNQSGSLIVEDSTGNREAGTIALKGDGLFKAKMVRKHK